ncbi:MAG: hypothetical protein N2512_10645 [Armatimonadetes bacterium]|nr:hypothetical protein [Armatimonadota bacterium]
MFHALVILDVVALAAAGGVWLSRPWWENVSPPAVAMAKTWAPMRLGDTGQMCWRPLEWVLRYRESPGEPEIWQWDAGPGGRLVVAVERSWAMGEKILAGQPALDPLLDTLSRRNGFAASPVVPATAGRLQGQTATFAFWQFGGLRPIAWCGWVFRAQDAGLVWTACATAPKQGWETFSADAWALVASIRPVGQAGNHVGVQSASD